MTYKTSINVIDFLVPFTSKFSVILSNFNPILGKKSPRCFPPNIFHQILLHRNFEDFHRKLHRNLAKSHRNFFHRKYFHQNFFSPKFFALNVDYKQIHQKNSCGEALSYELYLFLDPKIWLTPPPRLKCEKFRWKYFRWKKFR